MAELHPVKFQSIHSNHPKSVICVHVKFMEIKKKMLSWYPGILQINCKIAKLSNMNAWKNA